jgi:hypothetical protein
MMRLSVAVSLSCTSYIQHLRRASALTLPLRTEARLPDSLQTVRGLDSYQPVKYLYAGHGQYRACQVQSVPYRIGYIMQALLDGFRYPADGSTE